MQQEEYGEDVARIICELTGWPDALVVRPCGVFVKKEYLVEDPSADGFIWSPACDMDGPEAPDPLTAPSLPNPFTASQLAAFMLDGAGLGIQSRFGRIGEDPNEAELATLSMRATKVVKALREAYNLARRAQDVVGELDDEVQQRAKDLQERWTNAYDEAIDREKVMERMFADPRKDESRESFHLIPRDEYLLRLERANGTVATLRVQALQAKADVDVKRMSWRRSMVRQLLPFESTAVETETIVADGASRGAPMLKQTAQEARILELLTSKGHDPLNLPARHPGRRGVKFEIGTLANLEPALFTRKSFATAWQRLRDEGRLADGN